MCLWDIRLTEPIRTFQAHQGGMTQIAVHEHAPIFATYVLLLSIDWAVLTMNGGIGALRTMS